MNSKQADSGPPAFALHRRVAMTLVSLYAVTMDKATSLPPDRSHVRTEHRHPKSMAMDRMDVPEIIALMVDDHRTSTEAVRGSANTLSAFIGELVSRMREGGRLIYVGAGTSGRLGVLDASECPPTFQSDPGQIVGIIAGGDSSLRKSSEGKEDEFDGATETLASLRLTPHDTVLGIAAGGTTPYVLGALGIAKRSGSMTGLLTCAPLRQPPASCDHLILLDTGPEVLTGSTRLKAGSATKLALNIITTAAFTKLGKVHENLMVDLRATNAKLLDRAIRVLLELCPDLTRPGAAELLQRAGGGLKTAIVMQRLGVSASDASRQLVESGGSLRRAMGE